MFFRCEKIVYVAFCRTFLLMMKKNKKKIGFSREERKFESDHDSQISYVCNDENENSTRHTKKKVSSETFPKIQRHIAHR